MNKSNNFGLSLPSRNDNTDIADINVISTNFNILDAEIPKKILSAKKEAKEEIRDVIYSAVSTVKGSYVNLLEKIAQEDSETTFPTMLPAHKIGVKYNLYTKKFETNDNIDCFLFEVAPGDRLQISGYTIQRTAPEAVICILDQNLTNINNFAAIPALQVFGGIFPMPENARYVVLNTERGAGAPYISLVSERIIETKDRTIPNASKLVAPQFNGANTMKYEIDADGYLLAVNRAQPSLISNGIYPVQPNIEYIVSIAQMWKYGSLDVLIFTDENFKVNSTVKARDFDLEKNTYVFKPTVNDKYVAINQSVGIDDFQLGKNRPKFIEKAVKIGNGVFDGKHSVSFKDIGVVDRSLRNVKWVSYGDSITFGVGVDFVNGEKLWQDYVKERYDIGTHIKMGVGYSSLAYKSNNTEKAFCNDERLNALIAEAPDVVTILGGANDYVFGIPIGTDEDVVNENIETFKGAYAYIIDKILSAKPDTVIVLLGMFLNAMGGYGEGKGAYPLKEYAVATKEIAEHFGLPFVDLNECGFNKYNFNTTDGVFSTDGIHPNKEGVKRIAMVVSKWFDTFKGTIY
jgi:lysophospholipase L1-like esterase